MKTIVANFFVVFLSCASMLWHTPRDLEAQEVSAQLGPAENGSVWRAGKKSSANSIGEKKQEQVLQDSNPLLSTSVSKHARSVASNNTNPGPPAHGKNQAVSSVFQVSQDARDKVWLSVSNGIVTLWGSVGSRELAQRLLNRLAQISDIREVRNRLTLRAKNKDLEIATQLRDALSRDATTHSWAIAVSVIRGVVFLSGTVSSEEERTRAIDLALKVNGVRQVSNGLQVPAVNRFLIRSPSQRTVPGLRTYKRTR